MKTTKPYFIKKPIYLTIIVALMQACSQNVMAESFCGDRNALFMGGNTFTGDLAADECIEIGSDNFDNTPYAGLAINANLLPGSKLSINGLFKDSVVNGDSNNRGEVWISKKPRIAIDPYDERRPALGENIQVDGGLVRVLDGGTLKNSNINDNGLVYVTGATKDSGDNILTESGISIDNTVNNGGALYIYAGGESSGTVVNNGGLEIIQTEGKADRTVINSGGLQRVTIGGVANNTEVKEKGVQYVYNNGIADGTEVYGTQFVFADNGLATNTQVFGNGQQKVKNTSKVENVVIHDNGYQSLQNDAKATNVTIHDNGVQALYDNAKAANVTINDNAKSWLYFNTKILGQTNVNDNGQLQLTAGKADTGAYAEKVNLNNQNSTIFVIGNENKNDTDAVNIGELNGSGKIRFVNTTAESRYSTLNVDKLSGNHHFYFNTSIADGRSDHLFITEGSGSHKVSVADSGAEITKSNVPSLDLITDRSKGAEFSLANADGVNINDVDGGTYIYHLASRDDAKTDSSIWYLTTGLKTPDTPRPLITTPSTDAMLSMSSAPVLLMRNELSNLRFRKGELKMNKGSVGVWGRFIGNRSTVDSKQMQYKLKQTGLELGVDKAFDIANGRMVVGTFANYGASDVDHKRGGTSKIDSLGLGVYTTYFDASNIYLDATLKYSHFKNKVSAISTNGFGINGRYNQNGVGAALELGYHHALSEKIWAEPYAQLSYVHINSASTTLSNDMYADIGRQRSFVTELGGYLGKDFALKGNQTLTLYGKAAWMHSFKSGNSTEINHLNQFNTNLSGDVFKFGIGMKTQLSNDKLSLYGELNYAKGNKVKSPIMANIGIRYSF